MSDYDTPPPCTKEPELFHSPDRESPADRNWREKEAKALCAVCPLSRKEKCLSDVMEFEGGLTAGNRHGIYGGLTEGERAALSRGEPPKVACNECGQMVRPSNIARHVQAHGDFRHATPLGAYNHYKRGEKPCDPCREAANEHRRAMRAKKAAA